MQPPVRGSDVGKAIETMCGKDRRPFCRRPVQLEFLATTDVSATSEEEERREEEVRRRKRMAGKG